MDTGQTLVFCPSRKKVLGMLLGCAAFVATGIFVVRSRQWVGWVAIVFFGLGVVVFALQLLLKSTYVRVGPEGFTVCTLFRAHSCRWTDVGAFKVARLGGKDMVVFGFAKQYRGPRRLSRLNLHLVGAEAAVVAAGSWDVGMDELADILNQYRERYGAV